MDYSNKLRVPIQSITHQFWSPLLITDDARHSFSLTDHGSVRPTVLMISEGQKKMCQSLN